MSAQAPTSTETIIQAGQDAGVFDMGLAALLRDDGIGGFWWKVDEAERLTKHAIRTYKTRRQALVAMGCADKTIDELVKRRPWHALQASTSKHDMSFRLFEACSVLLSPVLSTNVPSSLFSVHCKQYLRQIAAGFDPDRPTPAELAVMIIQGLSHVAPCAPGVQELFDHDPEVLFEGFGGVFKSRERVEYVEHTKRQGAHALVLSPWWDELTATMCAIYRRAPAATPDVGKTRAERYIRALASHKHCTTDPDAWARR